MQSTAWSEWDQWTLASRPGFRHPLQAPIFHAPRVMCCACFASVEPFASHSASPIPPRVPTTHCAHAQARGRDGHFELRILTMLRHRLRPASASAAVACGPPAR